MLYQCLTRQENSDVLAEAAAIWQLGRTYYDKKQFTTAMTEFNKANAMLQEAKPFDVDEKLESQLLFDMGNAATETADPAQAASFYKEAIQIIKSDDKVLVP